MNTRISILQGEPLKDISCVRLSKDESGWMYAFPQKNASPGAWGSKYILDYLLCFFFDSHPVFHKSCYNFFSLESLTFSAKEVGEGKSKLSFKEMKLFQHKLRQMLWKFRGRN